jgi:LacI family transcriptional regulator
VSDEIATRPGGARRAVNSREVARLAGVSQATVSRVLSGHPNVAPSTRLRVLEAIDASGFVPNRLARSLVTSRSSTIGLVVSNITDSFYAELAEALCAQATEANLSVVLCNTQQDVDRQRDYLRLLVEQQVAGIVVASSMADAPYIGELVMKAFPIVLVNRLVNDVTADAVVIDNVSGAMKAVGHLASLGHSRIAFIRGVKSTSTSQDRESGFWAGLEASGIPMQSGCVLEGDFSWSGARQAATAFTSLDPRPTAALCADDATALGFMDGLANRGLGVPGDCAVVGFDDIRLASYWSVELTTIRQPISEMARLAMQLLIRRVNGQALPPEVIVLPAELVIRSTCGAKSHQRASFAAVS